MEHKSDLRENTFFSILAPISSDIETSYKPKVSNPRNSHQNLYNANDLTVL